MTDRELVVALAEWEENETAPSELACMAAGTVVGRLVAMGAMPAPAPDTPMAMVRRDACAAARALMDPDAWLRKCLVDEERRVFLAGSRAQRFESGRSIQALDTGGRRQLAAKLLLDDRRWMAHGTSHPHYFRMPLADFSP